MIYALYRDDGPKGSGGQCMSVTTVWTHLHIFHTVESWLKFIADDLRFGKEFNSRLNPRIEGVWDDDLGEPNPIHHGKEGLSPESRAYWQNVRDTEYFEPSKERL